VFREKVSGATADRPRLRKLVAAVSHGDVVIIPAVGRLSRDTTDLLIIVRDLQKAGVGLCSIAYSIGASWLVRACARLPIQLGQAGW
jgi:DNA invertase Pin-like site-specific DNA recombinase